MEMEKPVLCPDLETITESQNMEANFDLGFQKVLWKY